MPAAPPPPDEPQRLAALHDYGILDTPPEGAFEDIVRLAALICETPMALVTLLDADRQWFKAEIGIGVKETSREVSFCAHAVEQPGLLVVPDTHRDPRFRHNDLVTGEPRLRFYAGAPLRTPEGYGLGSVCVLDHRPRTLTPAQEAALTALARQAMAQLELHRALAAAARINQHRGRLMAITGHDLKQPLQTLAIALDRAGRRRALEEEVLSEANTALDRLALDLDRLVEASQGQAAPPPRQELEVGPLLAEAAEGWRGHAARRGVTLVVLPSSARILSDAGMLGVILRNLVGNAVKYTGAGGRVVIGCRRRERTLSIEVADNGIGIPQDRTREIFDAFRQLDPEQSEGLGMGLAIVRQTADLLGLRVDVTSREGRGSVFRVEAPRLEGRAARPVRAA